LPDLKSVGFDFEVENESSYRVTGVPAQLGVESVIVLLQTLIEKARTTAIDSSVEIHDI